ncbi:LacI family DNA-binding transcriptional regulator [Pseudonocardia xinjiangensis]|uniref:LacI family DNA-binding transcriptional regulator n=1 Tax=Pseudonocardia xinjiangensis TaxID=75289 RepID=UPI003D8CA24E
MVDRRSRARRTTMNDVARVAGVSSASVSYALTGAPGVSDELRERIRAIANELGYRPSLVAQGLKTGRARSIGLLLADITNPFYTEIAAGAVAAAGDLGYEVLISHVGLGQDADGDDADHAGAARLATVARAHIDRYSSGLLLTSLLARDQPLLAELRRTHVPAVQLYRRVPGEPSDWVGIDDHAAAGEIINHLLTTGRRHIAVLGGQRSSYASAAREAGFVDALSAAGLQPANLDQGRWGDISRRSGLERARELFARGTPIDAVACGNDLIALGVLDACREDGFAVPDDVAVTGLDDMSFASVGPLQLTTVTVPRELIGRRGVQMLFRRIEGNSGPPVEEVLPHQLRPRDTT